MWVFIHHTTYSSYDILFFPIYKITTKKLYKMNAKYTGIKSSWD